MKLKDITKEDFAAYEGVRESGILNMWSSQVEDIAGITKETKLAIMKHYGELCAKWPTIRDLS